MSLFDQDVQTEQSFLGCLLKEPDRINQWGDQFEDSDFIHSSHKLLWIAMRHLYKKGKPVDAVHLKDLFRAGKKLEEFGEMSYIRDLKESVPYAGHCDHYGELVRTNSAYRKVKEYADKLNELVHTRDGDTEAEVFDLVEKFGKSLQSKTISALSKITVERMDEQRKKPPQMIKTGFPAFDGWSGGIGRQWLHVLSGRSGTGKTAKAAQMTYNMAKQDEGAVIFWSQEMPTERIGQRIVSNLTGINYGKIFKNVLTDEEIQRCRKVEAEIESLPIYFDDSPSVTIGHVKSVASAFKRTHGRIAAIFVDYLTHMDIKQDKGQSRATAVGDVARKMKMLARELDCAVILLAQINREAADETTRPRKHHLKESGDIEQAADTIEILWADASDTQDENTKTITAIIDKGRYTGERDFKYEFKSNVQRFTDYVKPIDYTPNQDGFITAHEKGRKKR
ncbi:hypothetical protein SD71_10655 [Cohnella kolymensis]|uniref:DNA 5'-3' helicase n=1 Tax=Cohnella kolymensis TaxID=1590652 RepID=A0ABR5A5X3_9BACL|nr:DnaB-like helicase C-terminal domain-containing protein [Cohnella kolymensis]KIL35847.1 hypothetical protein SD71_10655 [Cohnella kolymensis]